VKNAWIHPTDSSRIGLFFASKLDLETFPGNYPGLDLVGKCFVAPRGPGEGCPEPLSDPVPQDYHVQLEQYKRTHPDDQVQKHAIWENMKGLVREMNTAQQLAGHPSTLSSHYLWVHSLTLPGKYRNFYQ